ncbi:MAG TPA: DUF6352 family protein [Burkholderiales bacterium]|nr:DUF6352 family protein [Burkholderiales bacterium]
MSDFWRSSGFHLLQRDAEGRLRVTDDFLRAYYLRPEIHPVEDSCDAELRLHACLMDDPRRAVAQQEIDDIADGDARDNYRILLRFRERLLEAGTVEGCYMNLFKSDVDVPPLFVEQLVHVILRNLLDACEDPLQLRAAELMFRDQKATLRDGHVLVADLEMIEMHAAGTRYGGIGRLIVEAQGALGKVDLDVLDRGNAAIYWDRESRFDTVLSLDYGQAGLDALCRVIEAWVAHFFGVRVAVRPLRSIEERKWAWHIGLDAESTAILNELWNGGEVEQGRMRRILALLRMDFQGPGDLRPELAGRPVYLALACDENEVVRMKPQNLLLNLPLAQT